MEATCGFVIIYPSERLVTLINERQIERHGGSFTPPHNLRTAGAIDLVLETIQTRIFGTDPYPTLYKKSTALAWKIITGHPFWDGNKRTGMATAITFLKMNGKSIRATYDEIVDIALLTAGSYDNGFSEQDLELWFYRHS
jgi:death on curing protein